MDKVVSDKLISESQFLAWALLVTTGITASVLMCCVRVFSKFTYSQSNYVELYRTVEEKIFDEFSKVPLFWVKKSILNIIGECHKNC
jgi:hypothetical protein